MRLSMSLAACIALSWPVAAAGRTLPADSMAVAESAAAQGSATDSAAIPVAAPAPTDYVAALTRQAMAAHLATGGAGARYDEATGWKARAAATLSWTGVRVRMLGRFASRPVVRSVFLPLFLLVLAGIVVWRLGAARGREAALRTARGRLRVIRDLAAGGARIPDIARRTHMAQEGVSLAMHLSSRRPGTLR